MARLKSQTFGVINGKVGNVVYRQVNGKTFVSIRPDKYNVTDTEKSAKVKNGFKNLVKFSSYINSISILKAVWSDKRIQRGKRTYNKIFSHNKEFIKSDKINRNFDIVPNSKNGRVSIYNFTAEDNSYSFIFAFNWDSNDSTQFRFISVILIYDNKSNSFNYQADELIIEESLEKYNSFIELTEENSNLFHSSEDNVLFHTLIVLDENDSIIDWSNSLGLSSKSE